MTVSGYGLAEKAHEDLVWLATSEEEDALEEAIVEVIRHADNHTGVLGGKGHVGCSLCAAVQRLRRWYGLE